MRKGHFYEQWYLYSLFGAQAKDMLPRPPPDAPVQMLLHHVIVMLSIMGATFTSAGSVLFVVGSFAMEIGSLFFNWYCLNKYSVVVQLLYQVSMAVSNGIALYLGYFMYANSTMPMMAQHLFAFANVALCLGRQRHALVELADYVREGRAFIRAENVGKMKKTN